MRALRSLRQGEQIAPAYRAIRLLRRGEEMDVYDAWSEVRECRCVAKVLRPDRRSHAGARAALLREGKLLLALTHPHLVRAYELVSGPRPALILETLSGATLGRLIRDNPCGLPLRDLIFLGLQLSSALGYLHRQGLLHLDLKPSNVISQAGIAKLLDLSVARPPGRPHRGLGTPQYMSPEQISGGVLTVAADAWGMGAVLYEAATGVRPFSTRRGRRAAPVLKRRNLPAALGEVIDACLQKDPSRRPALAEVASTLRALL